MSVEIKLQYERPKKVAGKTKPLGSMACPKCGHQKSGSINSYRLALSNVVVRRRKCYNYDCEFRWSTHERIEVRSEMTVVKRNKKREPFDRDKLTRSLRLALSKRNITEERIARIVNGMILSLDVQQTNDALVLEKKGVEKQYIQIPSERLGHLCLESLKELDAVSYMRYASIFYRFHDLADYEKALAELYE